MAYLLWSCATVRIFPTSCRPTAMFCSHLRTTVLSGVMSASEWLHWSGAIEMCVCITKLIINCAIIFYVCWTDAWTVAIVSLYNGAIEITLLIEQIKSCDKCLLESWNFKRKIRQTKLDNDIWNSRCSVWNWISYENHNHLQTSKAPLEFQAEVKSQNESTSKFCGHLLVHVMPYYSRSPKFNVFANYAPSSQLCLFPIVLLSKSVSRLTPCLQPELSLVHHLIVHLSIPDLSDSQQPLWPYGNRTLASHRQSLWFDASIVNKLVPCDWLNGGALEVWWLRWLGPL